MNKVEKNALNRQSKKEMEIFENNRETMMYFLVIINDTTIPDSAKIVHYFVYERSLQKGYCDLTDEYIHQQTKLSPSAVKTGIKTLRQQGWITIDMIPTASGSQRRIWVSYDKIRKACPRKEQEYEIGKFRGLAKRTSFHPEAIATYVLCNRHNQTFKSLKPVMYDKKLKPRSKVLCEIICSLSHFKGYCFAGDRFLGAKLGVSGKTVSTHVDILENEGIIRSNHEGRRRIYMNYETLRKRYLKKEKEIKRMY